MNSLQMNGFSATRLKMQNGIEKAPAAGNVSKAALSYWQELFNNRQLSPPECKYLFPDLNSVENEEVKELLTYKLTQEMSVIAETDWLGYNAVGLTAFWLKVLSEPRIPQLMKCKIDFISRVVEQLSGSKLFTRCSSAQEDGGDDNDRSGQQEAGRADPAMNRSSMQSVSLTNQFCANSPAMSGLDFPPNEFQRAPPYSKHMNHTNSFSQPAGKPLPPEPGLRLSGVMERLTNNSSLMTNNSSLMPNNSSLMPNNSSLMPNNSSLMPNNSSLMPNNSSLMPNNSSLMPGVFYPGTSIPNTSQLTSGISNFSAPTTNSATLASNFNVMASNPATLTSNLGALISNSGAFIPNSGAMTSNSSTLMFDGSNANTLASHPSPLISNSGPLMYGDMSNIQKMGPVRLTAGEMDLPESLLYQEDGKPVSGESAEDEEAILWTETLEGEGVTFSCKTCHYKSTYKSRIKQHMRSVHSTLKPYKCDFCDHTTAIRASLTKHINAVHRKSRPFSCNLCSYTCNLKRSLEVHISGYHQKQYKYTCQFCDYAASSKNVVDIHVQAIHMKERPYKCPHCDYSSAYPQYIPKHIAAVHERQKPFACPHCPYRSSYKTYLQKHCDAVHNNIKPYACPHCPYVTSYSQYLSKHISAVHNDEKPHKCPLCQFRCAYKQYINKHIELVHGGVNPSSRLNSADDGGQKPPAPPSIKEESMPHSMQTNDMIGNAGNTAFSTNTNITNSVSGENMSSDTVLPSNIKPTADVLMASTGAAAAENAPSIPKFSGSVFPGSMIPTSQFGNVGGAQFGNVGGAASTSEFANINNMLLNALGNGAPIPNNYSMSNNMFLSNMTSPTSNMFLGNVTPTTSFAGRESSPNVSNSMNVFPPASFGNTANYTT